MRFGYYADGRRTSLALPNGNTAVYNYDAASQLLGIVYQGGVLGQADLEYSYDLDGRRVGVSGSLAGEVLPAAVSSAVYNANNQLTQWGTTQMTYDLDGNTLNDGTNAYVWDARNRLVSANSGGAAYAYDPLGRRILKTLLSSSTGFLYDGVNPVQELNGTTPTANLLTGGVDERFQRTDSTGTYSYLTDALGSTMALTDSTGAQQATYSYGPYGSMSITGSTTNSYGYTGRESDGLGIDYYRARYYNPAIGRFISEDPMGFRAGPNFYAYAGDDPIDFIDPFGMDRGPNGCGGNDGTSCNDPWLPYENQLPWDQQGPGGCGGSGSAGGSGGENTPLSPRLSMGLQGGTNLISNTISLAANLSSGNWYGSYRSFFGMMSSDALIFGALDNSPNGIEAGIESSQLIASWSTGTGIALKFTGASDAEAATGSAAESTLWGLRNFTRVSSDDALTNTGDYAGFYRAIDNMFLHLPTPGNCSQ